MVREKCWRLVAGAASTLVFAGAIPADALGQNVDLSGIWYGGGGPTGRTSEHPPLTEHGHAVSDGFDAADDPHNQCEQAGLARHLTTPYPWKIEQYDDEVLFIYEEWEIVRTVHLDAGPPEDLQPSKMGYSAGQYVDGELIVNTTGLTAGLPRLANYFWYSSDQVTIEERYSRNAQGDLIQNVVMHDPVMLVEPWVMHRVFKPYEFELLSFQCELRERPPPRNP